jgi:O-antigen ligase
LVGYLLVAVTLLAAMYTFSRAGYLAILFSVLVLGILKDRKLLLVLGVFLLIWQSVVPTAVRERVNMTKDSNGQLEASAQERVDLWENAERSILSSPIVGNGFATFQLGEHVDNLKDTHNWYVKVLVETGLIGLILAFLLLQQLIALAYRLFRRASDPLYQGLGLGLLLATCSCVVSNFFGDRWTYVEITGLLWVLAGAAIRATHLTAAESANDQTELDATATAEPYMAVR